MSIDHPDTLQPLLIDSAISTALPDDIVGVSGRLFTDRHGLVYSVRPVATSSTLANGTVPQKRRYDQAYSIHSEHTNDVSADIHDLLTDGTGPSTDTDEIPA